MFEDWASNFKGPLRQAIGESPSTLRQQQVAKLAYEIWEKMVDRRLSREGLAAEQILVFRDSAKPPRGPFPLEAKEG
jgi:hypothetical protein